jgi:dihydroorotase
MERPLIIRNVRMVNEGTITETDVLVRQGSIDKIGSGMSVSYAHDTFEGAGLFLLPGMIDDQVHFREPGLTHKADIYTESRAAAAGGITSFMEMPNTVPNTLTQKLLQDKYDIASRSALVNYSFFMGVSNDNYDEVMRTSAEHVCGIKVFMGSSTGNMLVDDQLVLERLFANAPTLIATHCEYEPEVKATTERLKMEYGDLATAAIHPQVRNRNACYMSSSYAVELAKKTNARLHVLHISTAEELALFENMTPIGKKRITAEACIHHLWFSDQDYAEKGNDIKWNPSVKTMADRDAIRNAVVRGSIDIIATDHAPHTREEKSKHYWDAPSGGPLVQHALPALLDLVNQGVFDIHTVVRRTSHSVADGFRIKDRGYLREGYKADLVLVDMNMPTTVTEDSILYKCGWSPFMGHRFSSSIIGTWVNGVRVWNQGKIQEAHCSERLAFFPLT